jgi:hypothetical protein
MLALLPANAAAAFRLRVEDAAGNGFVITDQAFDGASGDLEGTLGRILVGEHELLPGVKIGYTAAETKPVLPAPGSGIYSQLLLSSIVVTTTRAASVSLFIQDTSYTNGAGTTMRLNDSVTGHFKSGGAGTTVTTQSWARADNQTPYYGADQHTSTPLPGIVDPLPLSGTTQAPLQTFVADGTAEQKFGGDTYAWFSDVGPTPGYSLYSAITIDFAGAGQVDFTHNTLALTAAPEPSALALFGAGLLGVVHVARRRRRSTPGRDL